MAGCDIWTALGGGGGLPCSSDQACAAGASCIDGRCRPGCSEDLDCHAAEHCWQNRCVARNDGGIDDGASADRGRRDATRADQFTADSGQRDQQLADARADASADAALARCGHLSAMQDDFERGQLPFWDPYAETGAALTQQDGLLEVATAAGADGAQRYAGRYSWFEADLRDDALAIEVVGLDLPIRGAEAYLQLVHDGSNALAVGYANGNLVGLDRANGRSETTTLPFEAATHRWWRIAEHAGSIDFSFSNDGSNWSVFFLTPTASHLARGYINVGAGTFAANAAISGLVQFDNLNFDPGRQPEPWCPASSLHDDFADGVAGIAWTITRSSATNCSVTWSHGLVQAEMQAASDNWCGIVSRSAYDLEQDAASIEVGLRPQRDGVWTLLHVWQAGSLVGFGYDGENLRGAIYDAAGNTLWSATDPDHGTRRLRIAKSGDLLQFSAASATGSWQSIATTQTTLHFDAVQVGAQLYSDISAPNVHVSATFMHYNAS